MYLENFEILTNNFFSPLQCRKQCEEIDRVISSVQSHCSLREQLFPVIIGRRPASPSLNDSSRSHSTGGTGSSAAAVDINSIPSSDSTNRNATVSTWILNYFYCGYPTN